MTAAIPDDIRSVAVGIASDIPSRVKDLNREFAALVIARALLAERNRATEAERERIAAKADDWARDLAMFDDKGPSRIMAQFASSIRSFRATPAGE